MAKVFSITLAKGGVGKTTLAQYLIEKLRSQGFKVLGIDLDPQANLTNIMLDKVEKKDKTFIFDVLYRDAFIKNDFIGSDRTTSLLKALQPEDREKMSKILAPLFGDYDYVIIDNNAKIDELALIGLNISDYIIIPSMADSFSLEGINTVIRAYNAIKQDNKKLKIAGVLLCKYSSRQTLSSSLKSQLEDEGKEEGFRVFETNIRDSVAIREAQYNRVPLLEYAKKSTAIKDFDTFFKELMEVAK